MRAGAVLGSAKFFLGTDSAPHAVPFAIESYAKTEVAVWLENKAGGGLLTHVELPPRKSRTRAA